MKVAQLMSKDGFACCCPHESLARASQLMWEHDCGVVPVTEDGVVVAMLTDRDVCMAAWTQGRRLDECTVSSAMSRDLFACHPTDELVDALMIMSMRQVHRLPVVDLQGGLVGMLTVTDLIRIARGEYPDIQAEELIDVLAAINRPRTTTALAPRSLSGLVALGA